MAGADQYGVNVLIHLQVLFVESHLPVGSLRFPKPPQARQPVRPQVGQDVLNAVETVGTGLDFKSHLAGGVQEVLLNIAGHQPTLLSFSVLSLEPREVHVCPRQRDTGGLLVLQKSGRVNTLNLI